jgi:protein-S-isoprenylcysteine O-methyltransferase Ste14
LTIPPVVLGLAVAALMWFVSWATPSLDFRFSARFLAAATVALIGAAISISGVISFRRARTTVNPTNPQSTSTLVISGVYKLTRNPMYLGFLLVLSAWAVYLSNPLAFTWLPVFVFYMNRFQIGPEERALASLFPNEYPAYHATVRRWI